MSLKNTVDGRDYYNFIDNIYIMFIPKNNAGAIEDLFDNIILQTEINGKKFNRAKKIDVKNEYGKIVFAEKVIKARQNEINFNNFRSVFDDIITIMNE